MSQQMFDLQEACSQILIAIDRIAQNHRYPILISLDGGSGAGKSTLASLLQQETESVVVQSDDFFAAYIPAWEWDKRSIPERARDVIDWQRLRTEALEPLLSGKTARWHPFDFEGGLRSDGTFGISKLVIERLPAPVIILEGAYSSNPVIADLIHLTVLVDVPIVERHKRLEKREADKDFLQEWHGTWDAVEEYYFTQVMPKSSFNLVVSGNSAP
jgi:uridine kinase